jgi:single-stranded-DNA-specific exonuclease
MAWEIEQFNTDRKNLDEIITKEALLQIEVNDETENFTTVVYQNNWHKGVIGIVASRLIETYYKPTLVFTKNGDKLAASARSVSGFDIYNALEQCSEYIEQFGGHKYAAGLTLLEENYEGFKKHFENVVKTTIADELLIPEIKIDLEIEIADITPKFYRILKQLAPFGPQNMKPVFLAKGLKDTGYSRKVGSDESHLKLDMVSNDGTKINGIGFNLGHHYDEIAKNNSFDIVFTIEENQWNGNTLLQLNVKDIRMSF